MIEFKHSRDRYMFTHLHPIIIMIYADLFNFAKDKFNKNLYVTQTLSTAAIDYKLNRVSSSHRTGRAIDIGVRNLTLTEINEICHYINSSFKYRKYKYQARSGAKRLAYYHRGTAPHIHLAIHARYALPERPELFNDYQDI